MRWLPLTVDVPPRENDCHPLSFELREVATQAGSQSRGAAALRDQLLVLDETEDCGITVGVGQQR